MTRTGRPLAILMAAALSLMAACDGGSGDPPARGPAGAQDTGAGKQAGPQPFDIFKGEDLAAMDYAVTVMRDECLAKDGFPQLKNAGPAPRKPAFGELLISAADFGPGSEQEARERGFGHDMPAEPRRVWSKDPNFAISRDRCEKQAWPRIGADAQQVSLQYGDLGNKLLAGREEVMRTTPPPKMAEQLADCVVQGGYPITDRQRWAREPSVLTFGVKFGGLQEPPEAAWVPSRKAVVEIGPPVPPRRYVPTDEESKLAVVWYRCTSRAGWPKMQYEAAIAKEAALVKQYEAQFAELNPKVEALAKRANELAAHP